MNTFIVNPVAGRGNGAAIVPKIQAECERLSLDYQIVYTEQSGHATALAAEHAADRLFCCGGDGTLNEVVNGVMRASIDQPETVTSLTHIPCGTGNDFIRCFGIKEDFLQIEDLVNGREVLLDCIEVQAESIRYAVNICSVGADADVAAGVERYKRFSRWGSKMPYNLSLLTTTIKGVQKRCSVFLEEQRRNEKFTMITCCNGQVYGGGFQACPDADPTDGQLEFLLVKGISRLTLPRLVKRFSAGLYKELPEYIQHHSGTSITIETKKPVNINCDGETFLSQHVTFALSPTKIRFIVPAL